MNTSLLVADNITELLLKIIQFTLIRRKLIKCNVDNVHSPAFVPSDLPVDEFSGLLNHALDEHVRTHRLLLRDTHNVRFGPAGTFEVKAVVDKHAKDLLRKDPRQYMQLQRNKLRENSLNHKLAAELLRKKNNSRFSC